MIRRVRGCPDSLTVSPELHDPHTWLFRGERVECEGVPKECQNDGCRAPIRLVEDFCSKGCWEEWHAKHEPEVLERVTPR
ncbi:hypothetical protein ACFYZ0_02410 [Streptomyces sp. NPDC001708]|uniref:hypothetical protein n=1 Tax=Streptomyces sp. NPDC001708 TaxID=3364602 RepID=UPI0036904DDF